MSRSTLETQGRLVESARGEPSLRAGSQARAKEGPRSALSPSDGRNPTASPAPMKTLLITLAATLTLVGAGAGHARELFVSPDGNDAHSGSRFHPLATLEIARDRLRIASEVTRIANFDAIALTAFDRGRHRLCAQRARDNPLNVANGQAIAAERFPVWRDVQIVAPDDPFSVGT